MDVSDAHDILVNVNVHRAKHGNNKGSFDLVLEVAEK
jgi:hypothetical protein